MSVSQQVELVTLTTQITLGALQNDGYRWSFGYRVTGRYLPTLGRIIIDAFLCYSEGGMSRELAKAVEALGGRTDDLIFPAPSSGGAAIQYARTAESLADVMASTLRDLANDPTHGVTWEEP